MVAYLASLVNFSAVMVFFLCFFFFYVASY